MEGTVPIPSPPGLPLLGNIKDINPELPLESFNQMADKYGERPPRAIINQLY